MDINKVIARAKAILLSPRAEWSVIAGEPETIGGLYSGYIVVMAAIPAIVSFISTSLIGVSMPFLGSYRIPVGSGLTMAVLHYVLTLVSVFIVTLIVEALAPSFGGEKNRVQALKAVAYSYTASWVASIIGIVPGLGIISALVGLGYGLYLLNLGLPATMKCPPEKSLGYTVVTVIAAIVVGFVLALALRPFYGTGAGLGGFGHSLGGMHPGMGSGMGSGGSFASGSAGAALQDYAKRLQDASSKMDAAQKSGDANAKSDAMSQLVGAALGGGKVESLAPDRIKPFLPDTLNGLPRTQASAERNGALGMQVSKASGTYSDGANHQLNLVITDTGSLKGLVGFAAGWGGVEQESENDQGYEKTYKSNGQIMHEKWNRQSQSGEFGVVVADRFSIDVTGNASSIDDLKAAAASVNVNGLAALRNEGVVANQ